MDESNIRRENDALSLIKWFTKIFFNEQKEKLLAHEISE